MPAPFDEEERGDDQEADDRDVLVEVPPRDALRGHPSSHDGREMHGRADIRGDPAEREDTAPAERQVVEVADRSGQIQDEGDPEGDVGQPSEVVGRHSVTLPTRPKGP
jgi:hypothetical protein